MSDDVLINDSQAPDIRTLVFDLEVDDLQAAVLASDSYRFHTEYLVNTDVVISTEHGPKSVSLYPHDGNVGSRSFEEFFDEDSRDPQDKSSVSIVYHDDEERVDAAASELKRIAANVENQ